MTVSVPLPPPGFDDLSPEEKLEYVQLLWERIAAQPEDLPVPEWHRKVLEERLKDYHSASDAGRSWQEVKDSIEVRLRERS